jgi:hypothetical protein
MGTHDHLPHACGFNSPLCLHDDHLKYLGLQALIVLILEHPWVVADNKKVNEAFLKNGGFQHSEAGVGDPSHGYTF